MSNLPETDSSVNSCDCEPQAPERFKTDRRLWKLGFSAGVAGKPANLHIQNWGTSPDITPLKLAYEDGHRTGRERYLKLMSEMHHRFVGRLDRWCELCNQPDRADIHKIAS